MYIILGVKYNLSYDLTTIDQNYIRKYHRIDSRLNVLMYDGGSPYQSSLSWMIPRERQTNILAKYRISIVGATHVLYIVIHWFVCE